MKTISSKRRLALVARHLRLMAQALESATTVGQVREVSLSMDTARGLIGVCLYNYQTFLLQNAHFDFDQTEVV